MDPVVLRLPRVDHPPDEPQFVLVHVSSAGARPLDLNLIGTDNDSGFSVSCKVDQIARLGSPLPFIFMRNAKANQMLGDVVRHGHPSSLGKKNSFVDQEDWEAILSLTLLGKPPEPQRAATDDVEAVAKVEGNPKSLTITLQKRIQGITQRLGSISLPEDESIVEEQKIDLYEWCGLIIISKNATTNELESLKAASLEKDKQLKKLEESLAELVKLKNENENQLLEKFSLLLNEKKLKIRDQQRLLASSNVDPVRLQAVEESRAVRAHSAGPSRKGKRKAGRSVREKSDDESDLGFEKMDVDEALNESEQEQAQTPDESTADEAESEDEAPLPPSTRQSKTGQGSAATASSSMAPPKEDAPPPKRELPFGKKPTPAAAKPIPALDGSETESDDEL